MKGMRKILIVLLVSLLLPMYSISQNTYPKTLQDSLIVITPTQLKETNLIFLEHKTFRLKIEELDKKITLQNQIEDKLNSSIILKDSIISSYERMNAINTSLLNEKDKQQKVLSRNVIIGSAVIILSILILK